MDATFLFTLYYIALAILTAYNAKFLGAGIVIALALSTVYPNTDAGGLLIGAALGVINFMAAIRE